jgi:hypothetical protein
MYAYRERGYMGSLGFHTSHFRLKKDMQGSE